MVRWRGCVILVRGRSELLDANFRSTSCGTLGVVFCMTNLNLHNVWTLQDDIGLSKGALFILPSAINCKIDAIMLTQ